MHIPEIKMMLSSPLVQLILLSIEENFFQLLPTQIH